VTLPLPVPASGEPVPSWVHRIGEVFAVFDQQDSGCVSYGVRVGDEQLFVKTPSTDAAAASLRSAVRFHGAVRHRVINPVLQVVPRDHAPVLVMPWFDGELLRHGIRDGLPHDGAWTRFRLQPVATVESVVDDLIDAHRAVVDAGFLAVDLYDGSMMYDFDRHELRLVDLDDYRPGPFVAHDRLPGSSRFMAPEEWGGGSTIDERTTVFVLGRAIRLLLGGDEDAWRGSDEQLSVVQRATEADPTDRFATVADLHEAWSAATGARVSRRGRR
jgi:serine/threonine protein kinase